MKKYREILLIIAFFIFSITINLLFILISNSSHPGTVTNTPYQKGMNYNDVLSAQETQNKLNYHINAWFNTNTSCFFAQLFDAKDKPIINALMNLKVVRPISDGLDFTATPLHIKNGLYSTCIKFPEPGQWHLRLHIKHLDAKLYHMEKIIVKI